MVQVITVIVVILAALFMTARCDQRQAVQRSRLEATAGDAHKKATPPDPAGPTAQPLIQSPEKAH